MKSTRPYRVLMTSALLILLSASPLRADADAAIAAKVETIIALNQHLGRYAIEVQSQDGRLRIEGSVPGVIERALAEDLANLVANGVPVDNALELDAAFAASPGPLTSQVKDLDVATKIRQRLGWQTSTSGLEVAVEVEGGIARLQGRVGSPGASDRVATLVGTTEGIVEVFNYINVNPDILTEERERQAAAGDVERSDTWIADRVNTVLGYDTTVNARSIEVIANDGVVLLRGTVTSLAERQVAEALAGDILGVREVESLLSFERPM
ncbi:BON domain-containing protein [Thiocapsa rosea]|uniref:Osmotically-inducible protein OsmY n=1 Tax=Thiocapsa rosea TaxID=69360 RepID=A0A495VE55_9GAMM|nr:BON domain-containing protein [Thiocapsa rosea]RKT47642.1 osmotically-inducible protein OsmY [Thiocapsa rosea]